MARSLTPYPPVVARRFGAVPRRFVDVTRLFGDGTRLLAALLFIVVASTAGVHAQQAERRLPSRLGGGPVTADGPAQQSQAFVPVELVPEPVAVLTAAGPLAADGTGRLLMLVPAGDGYAVTRYVAERQSFETIYRRKSAVGRALSIAPEGSFCIGTLTGVDCVNERGHAEHYEHPLLTNVLALTFTADGSMWVLRSTADGGDHLQLVRARRPLVDVETVLTLRQSVGSFVGNSMAPAADGGVFLTVVENETFRAVHVDSTGRLTRLDDLWRPGGAITIASDDVLFVTGVKRPQSLQEQRQPVDVVYYVIGETVSLAGRFPVVPSGFSTRMSAYAALGGDGLLHLIRYEPVPGPAGPTTDEAVLWRVPTPVDSGLGPEAAVIDFRVPFVDKVENPRSAYADYVGPLLVGRGQPLRIVGENFNGKDGVRRVLVGGVPARVQRWADDIVEIVVPASAPPGQASVRVAIDDVPSNSETIEVKTPDVPGWFQVGSPSMHGLLADNWSISGYHGVVAIEGLTEAGTIVEQVEVMDTPGLMHVRLLNGTYTATFNAAYVLSDVSFGPQFQFVGSTHTAVQVPEQTYMFRITDAEPIVLWMPNMLGSEE